jgi:4-hydroxybenzoate polyprenyltransferase
MHHPTKLPARLSSANYSTTNALMDSEERLISEAIHGFQIGKYPSLRAAAKAVGLKSHSKLSRRLAGAANRRAAHEQQQRLSNKQEEELVNRIRFLDSRGYSPTYSHIRTLVAAILRANGDCDDLGKNWIQTFKQRHPEVCSYIASPIESKRLTEASDEALTRYFTRLKAVIDEFAIEARDMWNMDETGVAIGASGRTTVMGASGTKRKRTRSVKSPGNRDWVSVIECISAGGSSIKPCVIFKGQNLQESWFPPEFEQIPDWLFTTSSSGYNKSDVAMWWLENAFLPQSKPSGRRTRLLLIDNHETHTTEEFIEKCLQNNVQVFYLHPHTTHLTQPLDIACFAPAKSKYRGEIAELAVYDDSAPVKKQRFMEYYDKARRAGLTPKIIQNAWRKAGIVPFEPQEVMTSARRLEVNTAPATPPPALSSTPSSFEIGVDMVAATPGNHKDFHGTLQLFRQTENSSRNFTYWLRKVGGKLEQMVVQIATLEEQNKRKDKIIHDLQGTRKRKKLQASPNSRVKSRQDVLRALGAEQQLLDELAAYENQDEANSTSENSDDSS